MKTKQLADEIIFWMLGFILAMLLVLFVVSKSKKIEYDNAEIVDEKISLTDDLFLNS